MPEVSVIDQILMADPETLTTEELDQLIEFYRAQRLSWIKAEEEAKSQGKRAKLPKPKTEVQAIAAAIPLSDLLGEEPKS